MSQTQTFHKKGVTFAAVASFPPAKKNCKPRQVKDKEEQLANIVNKTIPLTLLGEIKDELLWFFEQRDRFVHVDKYLLNCPRSQG